MSEGILGNATGGFGFPKTYILTDENGNELTGVFVESETIFTATDNDVREGMVYAGDSGVSTGSKYIPSYHTTEGYKIITNGSLLKIKSVDYDYTKLQALICSFNSNLSNSVATEQVSINNNVYDVRSTTIVSNITKNDTDGSIEFGIVNESGEPKIIIYFYYKEIY